MTVSIEKNIVKKHFLKRDLSLFYNELYWLKKFEKSQFTPKVIYEDHKNYTIHLSYVGKKISIKNKPKNWLKQLKHILKYLKKNNCLHSDIKPDNLLVKNKRIFLIDFAQSSKISNLKKKIFLKKRIFFDKYSINRINLSINKNLLLSNDLRVLVVWNEKNQKFIEKKIIHNKNFINFFVIKLVNPKYSILKYVGIKIFS